MPRTNDPTIAAGDLDRRVTLLAPILNTPEDEATGWQTVATVWAGIDSDFAGEGNEGSREVEQILLSIIIRYRSDIDARWRIQDHEHLYEIKGIQDIARRRVHLQLSCQEVM